MLERIMDGRTDLVVDYVAQGQPASNRRCGVSFSLPSNTFDGCGLKALRCWD
jgi:hypothetical protein